MNTSCDVCYIPPLAYRYVVCSTKPVTDTTNTILTSPVRIRLAIDPMTSLMCVCVSPPKLPV